MGDFKEALYESVLYSFGKVLADYNAFAQDTILRDIGKEIIDYLVQSGFKYEETGTSDDVQAIINLFTENGFAEVRVEEVDRGYEYVWKNLYGIGAYSALQNVTENPFLACPLNACLYYILSRQGKTIKLHSKSFDLNSCTARSVEEIVEADKFNGRERFDSLAIENRRLLGIAEEKNRELEIALAEINTLRGLIPICANCKKIRDKEGYWNQLESYIEKHSETQFTHGLCDECAQELLNNDS